MYILGISCYFHDAAAAILKDGELIAASEEERFSRIKHDYDFPTNAINFCLESVGIESNELDYVVFFEKPFLKFERLLISSLQSYPKSLKLFREAMITWFGDKLWIRHLIEKELDVSREKIVFSEHHLSHAASTFFCSPYDQAAILTVDGVGEWATTAMGIGNQNSIKLINEISFPHSIGLLYSAFTAFLGFQVNEGEYKVMGMAPFGEPKYVDRIYKVLNIESEKGFNLNMDYFSFHYSTNRTFNKKFEELFGEPREPGDYFFTENSGYPSYFGDKPSNYTELAEKNQYYADIAASIQRVTEELLIKLANDVYNETKLNKLCMAGGVALNSVANKKILDQTPFEEIYIQPASGDGGTALGAALYCYHSLLGNPRKFKFTHAYWGQNHSSESTKKFLEENSIKYSFYDSDESLIEAIAEYLINGKVIGWHQGKFEWGPRALGNRSILADPRNPEMKDIVNVKIKFREPFRPFAPSIVDFAVQDYFDIDDPEKHYPAKFMLYVAKVKEDKRSILPAITHLDGTGRLQIVNKDVNEKYYNLINKFGEKTGVPVLLNTSFNLKGEPVVNTPQEAFNTFSKSGMDILVIGNYVINKYDLT